MVAEGCQSEKKNIQKKVVCVLEKFCIIRYKKIINKLNLLKL